MPKHHKAVIIGAGQAGLSVSYFLTKAGLPHVAFDKGTVANSWSERWDSFSLVTPNWSINLPGHPYRGDDPNGFMPRDEFIDYMTQWAVGFDAPIRSGTTVNDITQHENGFALATSAGPVTSQAVIVATSTHQHLKVPAVADCLPAHVTQMHAMSYKNPSQVAADQAVLVVGSGQTGCQIVEDLLRAGRTVYLCVGHTGRLPRRYRGRDCIAWQRDMKLLDRTPDMLESPAHRFVGDPHVSGRDGGTTISLHDFHRRGVTLLGRLENATDDNFLLGKTLSDELQFADAFAARFYASVDAYIADTNLDAPLPTTQELAGGPLDDDRPIEQLQTLNAVDAGISTVIWATGFSFDFSWIDFPVTDAFGYPVTQSGATSADGLYFCGLNWMTKRKSGILYGAADDAKIVADVVVKFLQTKA